MSAIYFPFLSCFIGFVLYVVFPHFFFSNDVDFSSNFRETYFLFNLSILILIFLFFVIKKISFSYVAEMPFNKSNFLLLLLLFSIFFKCFVFFLNLKTGLFFSGERFTFLPLTFLTLVDFFSIAAIIAFECQQPNKRLFLFTILLIIKFCEMFFIDGSRRGLLFALIPFFIYFSRKSVSSFLSISLVASSTLIFLLYFGSFRNETSWAISSFNYEFFISQIQHLDFINIYQAANQVHLSELFNLNGITFIKPFLLGMLSLLELQAPPTAILVANNIYGLDNMSINPGLFGEVFLNFGSFFILFIPFLFLYLSLISFLLNFSAKSYIAISYLSSSLFLLWRGQWESNVYLIFTVFLAYIFVRISKSFNRSV
jgi:hypothetical protein